MAENSDHDEICVECSGRGWGVFNGNEIQRCDWCKKYESDEDAAEAVESYCNLNGMGRK